MIKYTEISSVVDVDKTCDHLKSLVEQINMVMAELERAGVEVRIQYVESSPSKQVTQGLSLLRMTQHIDLL